MTKPSSIRSAVSIELRLVTDMHRQTRTQAHMASTADAQHRAVKTGVIKWPLNGHTFSRTLCMSSAAATVTSVTQHQQARRRERRSRDRSRGDTEQRSAAINWKSWNAPSSTPTIRTSLQGIQGRPKKWGHRLMTIILSNLNRFLKNIFTIGFPGKFLVKWRLKFPPHLFVCLYTTF